MKKQIIDWWSGSSTSSAFDDVWGWWRADDKSGVTPNVVLNDKSGNGRTMTQAGGTLTAGTAANGQAMLTGGATARLLSSATLKSWPITIITVGKRTASATCGFFGHTGATGYNTLWHGYESTNRNFIYNTNSTNNTTAEAGTTSCYVARIGWGSRVALLDGIILADMPLASVVRSGLVATEIGTQYRGLNMDWQECLVWDRTLTLSELDEVHAYINQRYSKAIPLWSSYSSAPTIWMGGQSNSAGRGDRGVADVNIPAEYDGALTNVNVWYGATANNANPTAFETLNINTGTWNGNHMLGDNETLPTLYIGHELTMTKEYIDRVGGSVYLHKYAIGGSNLAYRLGLSYWNPTNETPVHNSANRIFNLANKSWWLSLRVHQTNSRKPSILGLVWFQGEQDATTQVDAEAYAANGLEFFNLLADEMGVSRTHKKLICRIHINGSETYESTVRAQQATLVSSLTNATLIDTDSYGTRGADGVHLSFQGQLDLGTYLASLL